MYEVLSFSDVELVHDVIKNLLSVSVTYYEYNIFIFNIVYEREKYYEKHI